MLLRSQPTTRPLRRSGAIAVLSAFLVVVLLGMLAFAVDIGYLVVARTEMQRAADAAAVAAAWQYVEAEGSYGQSDVWQINWKARQAAEAYARANRVLGSEVELGSDDVTVGALEDFADHDADLRFHDSDAYNAVQIRVRRSSTRNGEVPLFFARVLGQTSLQLEATATAALLKNIDGFTIPPGAPNLGILPFALDEVTWNGLLAGEGEDGWSWDPVAEQVVAGSDGMREANLFPQGTGSPGNRGTVDIGSANNSTSELNRQIREGVSAADLAYHGGALRLNEQGELHLGADTGISAGVKGALDDIVGLPRVIPIFREVNGVGNNAVYTIVGFVGVRVLEVDLSGSGSASSSGGGKKGGKKHADSTTGKRVIIQPATVVIDGALPASGAEPASHYIYSKVRLVR